MYYRKKNTPIDQFIILNFSKYMCQGWGLRKITKSPTVPNDEILGAQHLSLQEKVIFLVAWRQMLAVCGTMLFWNTTVK